MKPFFFFLCFLFLFGCEKATKYNSSPRDNFEALWRIMDENYCFFAFKDVDWDDVYDRSYLLVNDTMPQYVLFDILEKMLAEVKDGHTNLIVIGVGMKIIRLTSIKKYRTIILVRTTRLPGE